MVRHLLLWSLDSFCWIALGESCWFHLFSTLPHHLTFDLAFQVSLCLPKRRRNNNHSFWSPSRSKDTHTRVTCERIVVLSPEAKQKLLLNAARQFANTTSSEPCSNVCLKLPVIVLTERVYGAAWNGSSLSNPTLKQRKMQWLSSEIARTRAHILCRIFIQVGLCFSSGVIFLFGGTIFHVMFLSELNFIGRFWGRAKWNGSAGKLRLLTRTSVRGMWHCTWV